MTDPLTDPETAGTWMLDPQRSSVRFTARTLWGLVPVKGRFTAVTGEGLVNPQGHLSGRLVVRADSVKTGIGMRDHHLQAADFFDAGHFPEIVVDVTGIAADGSLSATLTIRGTTLPVPMATTATRPGAGTLVLTARAEIDRTRWGVGPNPLGMMPPTTTLMAEAVFVH